MNPTPPADSPKGILSATAAFFLWGVLPIYWKQVAFLPPASIISHRTLGSLFLLIPLIIANGSWPEIRNALRQPKAILWHLCSGLLLASNWLLYVWATLHNHVLDGALGYYLNPFFNMAFGALWFGERQRPTQWAAVALAGLGVALQFIAHGSFPWIAVTLASTFSLYAVVRKKAPLSSLPGLTLETLLMAPIALTWLVLHHPSLSSAFGHSAPHAALIAASGLATAVPLLFFGYAARTIRLTTLGILQFLGPTLQFLIGWLLYGEWMTPLRLTSFAILWTAIALYALDAWKTSRRPA